ncbi:DeoR/GlpR family DNA-binding transcription regulator [Thermoflavimicrobium daqui]|uniref:DeoR family transcriptional regulator n=1 Tax=Thermoflavimicrobium daqui TaxID=2137476 RepID=A0A364K154_9BACL|nr:DeoR family transcriptional regulator [Thermoflavimicrobium daqui]
MLTSQRYQLILDMLKKKGFVKLQDLILATGLSESTIRRDLIYLEKKRQLKRVHGGAALLQGKTVEPSIAEKSSKNLQEKKRVATFAASLLEEGDCIYLDAGSTTIEMIPELVGKKVTVVTNGISHLEALVEKNIPAYVLGGKMKESTRAIIGALAVNGLQQFRFDKCFLGVNGIHPQMGYTTPDPEEALLKRTAMQFSSQTYFLADHNKFMEVSFAKIASLDDAILITDKVPTEIRKDLEGKLQIFEVDQS